MDTRAADRNWNAARADGDGTWLDYLYAACKTLRASTEGMINAMSVTLPWTDGAGHLAEVELLCAGLSEMYQLDATVTVRENGVTVRFSRRPIGSADR